MFEKVDVHVCLVLTIYWYILSNFKEYKYVQTGTEDALTVLVCIKVYMYSVFVLFIEVQ